jgi:hypothetical protein
MMLAQTYPGCLPPQQPLGPPLLCLPLPSQGPLCHDAPATPVRDEKAWFLIYIRQ